MILFFIKKIFFSIRFRLNSVNVKLYSFFILHFCKLESNVIVFFSSPDYSDNAKALYNYMCANGYKSKYTMYFVVKELHYCKKLYKNEDVLFIVSKNKYGGVKIKNLKILLTAGALIYTHSAPYPCVKHKSIKGQRYINLWHGCGYKDNQVKPEKRGYNFDLVLVPGSLFVDTKMKFWNAPAEIIIDCGYPRYDWLLKPSKKAVEFAKKIKGKNKRLIIWMPTFRNDRNNIYNESDVIKQFPLLKNNEYWINLDTECQKLDIRIIVKLHQFQKKYSVCFNSLKNIICISDYDFNRSNVNLYEFLPFTDALISDYSSVAIDYLLVDHPIAFALEDYDIYKKTRGFVFDDPLLFMPGHHMYNYDDLKLFLNDLANNNDKYKYMRDDIRKKAISASSCYSKDVIKQIGL